MLLSGVLHTGDRPQLEGTGCGSGYLKGSGPILPSIIAVLPGPDDDGVHTHLFQLGHGFIVFIQRAILAVIDILHGVVLSRAQGQSSSKAREGHGDARGVGVAVERVGIWADSDCGVFQVGLFHDHLAGDVQLVVARFGSGKLHMEMIMPCFRRGQDLVHPHGQCNIALVCVNDLIQDTLPQRFQLCVGLLLAVAVGEGDVLRHIDRLGQDGKGLGAGTHIVIDALDDHSVLPCVNVGTVFVVLYHIVRSVIVL